jgi:hypothetical protein
MDALEGRLRRRLRIDPAAVQRRAGSPARTKSGPGFRTEFAARERRQRTSAR